MSMKRECHLRVMFVAEFGEKSRAIDRGWWRAGLERFGLVHVHKKTGEVTSQDRGRKGEKSRRYRPWVVAPISMAATPAAFAGGGDRAAAASSTRTTTAEVSTGRRSPRSL